MPMRKSHHKSKLGCTTCKKRRLKCDLGRPDCRNCIKRGVDCGFRTFDPAPRSLVSANDQRISPVDSVIQSYAGPSVSLPSPTFLETEPLVGFLDGFPDVLRPRFKQLLHHHATETSISITHDGKAREAWCAAIPQLTASNQFVLKGIFAISALHLSRIVNVERERSHFYDIAVIQMNTGLIQYRKALEDLSSDNANALFVYSVIATAFTLLSNNDECLGHLTSINREGQDAGRRHTDTMGLVGAIVKVMRSLRGVLVILVPCWHLMMDGILSPVLNRSWWPQYPIPTSPQAIEEDCKLRELERLWMQPGRRYDHWVDTLREALKKLRDDFARISLLTVRDEPDGGPIQIRLLDWTSVFAWPVGVSAEFCNLLEKLLPEAWVILAHYAILLSRAGERWWMKDLGPNIVSTTAFVLGKEKSHLIEWPASVVGVNLRSLYIASTGYIEAGS